MKYSHKFDWVIILMVTVLGCANGQIKEQLAKQQERIERIEQEKKIVEQEKTVIEAYNKALLNPELYRAYHLLVFATNCYTQISINVNKDVNKEYATRAIDKALELLKTEKKCSYIEFAQYKNMALTVLEYHNDPKPEVGILRQTISSKKSGDSKPYILEHARITKSASPDFEIFTIWKEITSKGKSNSKFLSVLRIDDRYYIRHDNTFEDESVH